MAFVEDFPVFVPALEGGAIKLGGGWDCKGEKPVPLVSQDYLEINAEVVNFPKQTLDYELKHIRDTKTKRMTLTVGLGMEMTTFFGLTINVGKAQYTSEQHIKLQTEHLQIYYLREDNVTRVLPSEEVRYHLINGILEGQGTSYFFLLFFLAHCNSSHKCMLFLHYPIVRSKF